MFLFSLLAFAVVSEEIKEKAKPSQVQSDHSPDILSDLMRSVKILSLTVNFSFFFFALV